MTPNQKADSVNRCLLEEHFCQVSSRSDLKRRSLRFFEDGRLNNKKDNNNNNNQMSSNMRSVSDLKKTTIPADQDYESNLSISFPFAVHRFDEIGVRSL